MNKATLIKKELLPNNFKLTFKNQGDTQFLILHEEHKELYSQLELNQEYFYTWKKGNKNYCFINPHSIRKNNEKTEHLTEKLGQERQNNPQKGFFVQQLIKDLKLKDLTKEEFLTKMENLKDKFKRISQSDNLKFTFEWVKQFITTLYLKHKKLEKEAQHNYTEQEEREQKFVNEIGILFLEEWIYYQDKRESRYNRHYYLTYLKNKKEK
ncbi:MAG: hypothetical protein MRECE_48c006 [Mycoplasmataceae bacterium CE_OT135]|nr:MAG: hypothetical protein MRECE_48c006 [Mycoplasmataceae bacterium CE_OT135]